jgi:CBS domain-containing protein
MPSARDPIGTLVRGRPVSVDEKLTLRSVAAVLGAEDIGAALVERDDGSIGIVSERDVTRALADNADPDVVWSADIMSDELVTARASEPIMGVALRLIEEGIRHVAVVDDDNNVTGIVSSRDVFRVLAADLLGSW